MLRGLIPQLEALKSKRVMLVMGFCKMPGRNFSFEGVILRTEAIIRALEMDGANPILLIDMRNECRRDSSRLDRCLAIKQGEAEMLLASNAVELRIALEAYDIDVRSVDTFAACWTGKSYFQTYNFQERC